MFASSTRFFAIFVAALPATVQAQDTAQAQNQEPRRDTVTVGVGAVLLPRYEGSGDYELSPGAAMRGQIGNVSFLTVGSGLLVDVIPQPDTGKTKLIAGPVAQVNIARSSLKQIRDPQIQALGKIGVTVELGAQIGVSQTGILTPGYDTAAATLAVTHDVGGVHGSTVLIPSLNYGTPLSRTVFVGVSLSATHVGRGYAQRYFGVTPAQATASGLPAYSPSGGFKDVGVGGFALLSLTGDLQRGAALFVGGNYARLQGAFARSPIVKSRDQWFAAVGLAYTF